MVICALKAALNSSGKYAYKRPDDIVDHIVIGGGAVGLAIARLLSIRFPDQTTYLIERHQKAGEETSSRNSEVIHAGLYYPLDSLKASLCIRGRDLLYRYCTSASVPFRRTGKIVVALPHQRAYIESLREKARKMTRPHSPNTSSALHKIPPPHTQSAVPTELISGETARELEPDLSPDISVALLSPETGIIDSHTYMESLERDITDSQGGQLVYATSVVRVDPYDGTNDLSKDGWVVQTLSSSGESYTILARTLINSAGLSAPLILNSLLPDEKRISMYYARGSYAAYSGPGVSNVSRLIYPCPDTDKTGHAFQSLGTHLTLDLNGNIKFGPDLQWISPRSHASQSDARPVSASTNDSAAEEEFSDAEDDIDFWKHHLVPDDSQLDAMHKAVRTYLPNVDGAKFRPDYCGIRPKLVPPWGGFQDFVFRTDFAHQFLRNRSDRRTSGRMVTLMGIESPGLTASLAIAEKVLNEITTPH
ncbi:pyridine nucleotide disulfide oxidoreductase-like protein [Rickenella mellea]|uniref:L-2-hydroxyglutarate dehydrogenase, mitochondrial n=1 Tax=Rickenella mellea TaxID=50990 RepID=A0A4R5XG90_9AGAM|nr:pyridine nucleotide disulfide oxidoreductase-like protein [Rickenella mellea]